MGQPLETHIRKLQDFFWSDADPQGRGFVPLADALRKGGDFREAHRVLREGLNRCPEFLSGHVVAGWLARDRGELDDAEASFKTALDLDSQNVAALRGLGEIRASRGELESALNCLRDAQRADPSDLSLLGRVSDIQEQIRVQREKRSAEEKGTSLMIWEDPEAAAEDLDWGAAALQEDRPYVTVEEEPDGTAVEDEAVSTFQDPVPDEAAFGEEEGPEFLSLAQGEDPSMAEDARDSLVTSTLGDIYVRQGLYGRAEEVFEALLDREPENEEFAARLAEVGRLKRGEEPLEPGDPTGTFEGAGSISVADLAPEVPSVDVLAPDGPEAVSVTDLAPEFPAIDSLAPDAPEPVSATDPAPEYPAIESLGPDTPLAVSVVDLAPEVPSFDAFAPEGVDAISVTDLAPDFPAIDSLAPDAPETISVTDLAPGGPDTLSPSPEAILSIDALAPDSDEDPTLDAFESWLEKLQ